LSQDIPPPPEDVHASPEAEAARARKIGLIGRRWSRRRIGTWGFLSVLVAILLAGLTVRLGVLTDPGRAVVVRLLDRQAIGRLGRLRVEGLSGDVFGDFTLRRLAIVDSKGTWLDARDVALRWNAYELVLRRFHAQQASASVVQVLRRPELSPAGAPGGPSPVSVRIDDLRLRLETLPAFSVRQGVWDVSGELEVGRHGTASGRLDAQSRLHAGDGLAMLFRFAPKGRMTLRADAVEASGGGLAGALGLAAGQRFFIHVRAEGTAEGVGSLTLDTQSGPRKPLVAKGGWGKEGASLDAHVLLDASSLSAGYAAKVGPEVHVVLRARQSTGDLYQLDAAAIARDATILAKGPIDWRRQTAQGVALQVSVADVQRWLDFLHAGPLAMTGTLTGAVDRWRYEGRAQLKALDQWGYRLASAVGPTALSFAKGEIRVQTDLTTAGGAGEGLMPTLFGPAPRIRLDLSRLPGGRIMIRDLGVDGAGLAVKAAGDRSILGRLSLKGDLVLSRLERAHPGAKGLVRAGWTASQAGKEPWKISADAHGEGFATGYAEVDRLLGAAPKFNADAAFGAEGLSLARSQITGEAMQASVRGTVDPKAVVALDVDWRAKGPFAAGPVEIAGEAAGTGKVTGRFVAPVVDLAADLPSLAVGRLVIKPAHLALQFVSEGGLNGQVVVSGPSEWGQAKAAAHFRFSANGVDLTEVAADAGGVKASGALSLRDGAPSTADLTLAVGPGAVLASGKLAGTVRIQDRPGGAAAQLSLDGQNLQLPGVAGGLKTLRLRADGPFAKLPFQVSADADQPFAWRFGGEGVLTQTGAGAAMVRQVSLNGTGRVRQADLRTLEPLVLRAGPAESTVRIRMAVGTGRADLDARQAGPALDAHANVTGVELAGFANAYMGKLSGALTLAGRGERLNGSLDAAIEGGRDRDAPADVALSAKVHADLAGDRVKIAATAANPQGLAAKLDLDVPAAASAAPFRVALVRDRPVAGAFDAEGELRPLWDLFAGSARTLSGRGAVHATLAGDLNSLRPTGQASIEGGRFQDVGTGLDLRNLAAQASFDRAGMNIQRFAGDDGQGGRLSGSGKVSLADDGASTFSLALQRFRLLDNDLARASASGQVTVTRDAAGKARLAGALTIDRADITAKPPVPTGVVPLEVVEINRLGEDGKADLTRRDPGGPQILLDVTIKAARGVFIKGNGLDAEMSVDAHVVGTTAAPELTGVARVVRGEYQFAGKRFEFDESGSIRLGSHPEQIRLDLTASRDDPTLHAIVRITGTAARPEIALSSTPVLPQDEVLSQVLFGRSASQLTPLEAAQLASAISGLATGGGLDVLGNLRQFARLDSLAVSGGSAGSATTISGGKYLTRDLYLVITGGAGRTTSSTQAASRTAAAVSSAQLEWRVRHNFSIVSTVGTQGEAGLSVRFRHNY
jgi:translocation and assembly module TamB